jgi:hypothetical protein
MRDEHRKDARAERMIRHFAGKLRKLGGGEVPDSWQQLVAAELKIVSLSGLMKRFTSPRPPQSRGRPRIHSAEDDVAFISVIDEIKTKLLHGNSGTVPDRKAIRHLIKDISPSISEHKLKAKIIQMSKELSRARPAALRRSKRKKSQKSR